jgi:hypothetical protein
MVTRVGEPAQPIAPQDLLIELFGAHAVVTFPRAMKRPAMTLKYSKGSKYTTAPDPQALRTRRPPADR